MNDAMIHPICELMSGTTGTVVELHGGRAFQDRLMSMGLAPGAAIRIVRQGRGGPVLVAVGETRLAIGRGMSEKVFVEVNACPLPERSKA